LRALQFIDLDRGMADDIEKRLVAPHVVLERGNVQIADQHGSLGPWLRGEPFCHLVDERQLVGKFIVELGIGLVAAGRHVEIMNFQSVRRSRQSH